MQVQMRPPLTVRVRDGLNEDVVLKKNAFSGPPPARQRNDSHCELFDQSQLNSREGVSPELGSTEVTIFGGVHPVLGV